MSTTGNRTAIEALSVLYLEDNSTPLCYVICDPEMMVTQSRLAAAVKAIGSMEGVCRATQSTRDDRVVISVHFDTSAGSSKILAQKRALHTLLAPQFVLGQASGYVLRDGEGRHYSTFLRLNVAQWAADEVLRKLRRGIDEIKQSAVALEYANSVYITGIGFTTQKPTRDPALNREQVINIAQQLGITLEDTTFKIADNLMHAVVPELNRKGDPIDGSTTTA